MQAAIDMSPIVEMVGEPLAYVQGLGQKAKGVILICMIVELSGRLFQAVFLLCGS